MRVLNEFVEYIPFRVEDIFLLKSVLKQGDFMTKLDLRGAYLAVPVDKNLSFTSFGGCTIPIHLPPCRSLFFMQNFHQSNEASDCVSEGHRDQIINFSR